jgi:hypothetical protein
MPLTSSQTESGQFYILIEDPHGDTRYIYLHDTATSVQIVDDRTFIVHTEYSGSMEYTIYKKKVSSPKPVRAST